MVAFLQALNSMSPLGIIALLGVVIFYMIKFATSLATSLNDKYKTLTDNHLHELPQMAASLDKISDTLQRVEVGQATLIALAERK